MQHRQIVQRIYAREDVQHGTRRQDLQHVRSCEDMLDCDAGQDLQHDRSPQDVLNGHARQDLQHLRARQELLDCRSCSQRRQLCARKELFDLRSREELQHEHPRKVVLDRREEARRQQVMPMLRATDLPRLGAGVGYRAELAPLVRQGEAFACLELMPEHVLDASPAEGARILEEIRHQPTITHAISMSIGSAEGPNRGFLELMRGVSDRVDAPWVSDHLCFTRTEGKELGQLVPIPYTHEALDVVVRNVREAQRILRRPLALENVTRYFAYKNEDYTEPEFLSQLVQETGCFLLLDVTNVHNNDVNLGWDAETYLRSLPMDRVIHLHLAGVHEHEGRILDTHAAPVPERVWRMTERVLVEAPVKALIIERDDELGDLPQLLGEVARAARLMEQSA